MKCDYCGKEFERKYRIQKNNFCDNQCYVKWKKGKKMCLVCRHYFPKKELTNGWPGYLCKKCRGIPRWKEMKQLSL